MGRQVSTVDTLVCRVVELVVDIFERAADTTKIDTEFHSYCFHMVFGVVVLVDNRMGCLVWHRLNSRAYSIDIYHHMYYLYIPCICPYNRIQTSDCYSLLDTSWIAH